MEVVLISDVHLEFYKQYEHPIDLYKKYDCDTLIIAGDFSQPLDHNGKPNEIFIYHLRKLRSMYKYVIYVTGNHEYYRCLDLFMTTQDVDHIIEKMCDSLDIHFLQKSCWIHPLKNILFAGCTLWSQIDYGGKTNCNDFMRIFDSTSKYLELHNDHKSWLENIIKETREIPQLIETHASIKTIVVTHHLPTLKMIGDSYKKQNNTAFATDLDYLLETPLIAWFCGHSHCPKTEYVNGILVVNNATGYPHEINKQKNPINI